MNNWKNKLHVYGQPYCHDDLWVVGDEQGLLALRDALNEVLSGRKDLACGQSMTADGEGFDILVWKRPSEDLDSMLLPYVDWELNGLPDESENDKHPVRQVDLDEYRHVKGLTYK